MNNRWSWDLQIWNDDKSGNFKNSLFFLNHKKVNLKMFSQKSNQENISLYSHIYKMSLRNKASIALCLNYNSQKISTYQLCLEDLVLILLVSRWDCLAFFYIFFSLNKTNHRFNREVVKKFLGKSIFHDQKKILGRN